MVDTAYSLISVHLYLRPVEGERLACTCPGPFCDGSPLTLFCALTYAVLYMSREGTLRLDRVPFFTDFESFFEVVYGSACT